LPVAWLAVAIVLSTGCVRTQPIAIRNGALDLNPRLRGDLGASAQMPDGRFFSDGSCSGAAGPLDECHFIATLRNSLLTPVQLQHLRRADYFWMESEGFPQLSHEVIARDFDVVKAGDSSSVITAHATAGSCGGLPLKDVETRQPIRGLEHFAGAGAESYFDVTVRECAVPVTATISDALTPVTDNCTDRSVRQLSGAGSPAPPQTPPLCLTNVGIAAALNSDLSYTLIPSVASGQHLETIWTNLSIAPLPIGPQLKVIPVGGIRTISRQMQFDGVRGNPDGSQTYEWSWMVPVQNDGWAENFSPNTVVIKARVRKGPIAGASSVYLPVIRLDVGRFRCLAANAAGDTSFAVQTCEPEKKGGLNVTPTYDADTFSLSPVDDSLRLQWKAQVLVPAGSNIVSQSDTVSLELDLTAVSAEFGQAGAGLLGDPASRDLGVVPTGANATEYPVFTVRNPSLLAAWIDSIVLSGADAAEFGAVNVLASEALASNPPASLAPPVLLASHSALTVGLVPSFSSIGDKHAAITVTYEDLRGTPQTLSVFVKATAATPTIVLIPSQLGFYTQSDNGPAPHVERNAVLENAGVLPVVRQTVSIVGPNASDFFIVRSLLGSSTPSDLSQPLTMQSGDTELYTVGFYPSTTGRRDASLLIHTSGGDAAVPLIGDCEGDCRQVRIIPPPRCRPGDIGCCRPGDIGCCRPTDIGCR
jgi:hypothetical protein